MVAVIMVASVPPSTARKPSRAMSERRLGGAGIDVLSHEPPSRHNPLLTLNLPNLIVTPHVAWAGRESRQRLIDQVDAMKNIIERLAKNNDAILGESVLSTIQQHGTSIEHATRVLEKLAVRCPELRPETNEFPKVEGADG